VNIQKMLYKEYLFAIAKRKGRRRRSSYAANVG
jgi:hypothetical protein